MVNKIRAFVGHSFSEDDKMIVSAFLQYFDTLKDAIDFQWDHAEKALPKELSEKVKRKMEGKNLFIGICTAREKAISPIKLKKTFFSPPRFIGRLDDFRWLTSGWILQEMGYAIAKGMNVILIVEEGIQKISGLQGDLEFVSFSREKPSEAFNKILQMIGSLSSPELELPPPADRMSESPEPEPKASAESEEVPSAEWTEEKYDTQLIGAILDKDTKREEEVIKAYLKSPLITSDEDKIYWEAKQCYWHYILGDKPRLNHLERIGEQNQTHRGVHLLLGKAYKESDDLQRAYEELSLAATLEGDMKKREIAVLEALQLLAKAGKVEEAERQIMAMTSDSNLQDKEGQSKLLETLAEVERVKKNSTDFLAYGEAVLARNPDDESLRFDVASQYEEIDEHAASAYHYKILTHRRESGGDWNNLGVAYSTLNLLGKAAGAYKRATDLGSTTAMGNLAHKLIVAGFLDEAGEWCDKAIKIPGYDKYVGTAISKIQDIAKEENQKEENEISKAKKRSELLIEYANACLVNSADDLSGKWKGPKCDLEFIVRASQFVGTGSYYIEKTDLASIANKFLLETVKGEKPKNNTFLTYEGTIRGCGISYKLTIKDLDKSIEPKEEKGFMVYDRITKQLKVFDFMQKDKASVYFLSKL